MILRTVLLTLRSVCSRAARNRDGVAAVEFALILPLLLILAIGMAETTEALNHDQKVSKVASTMADLVAQSKSSISEDIMDSFFLGAEALMLPYDDTNLTVAIASVTYDINGLNPTVDWSYGNKARQPWAKGAPPPFTMPATLGAPNLSLIVAEAEYTYTPMFATLIQNIFPRATSLTLEDRYYLRPRLVGQLACTDCQ
ncbi:hypothetical protein GCM10011316_31860 [Roseibium aquae]|uniref:TadE-like domain-containing protein n=1 Tax=Roseibium aquae TaxID=1323746 RepID=A0A916TM89_9HYPH|nr:TadE/TadG family type IV pilus assembly protein [Roseibium aquae]GGB57393.1 hypothetical protein GCM10011316_31860 [Roseibium aquae]